MNTFPKQGTTLIPFRPRHTKYVKMVIDDSVPGVQHYDDIIRGLSCETSNFKFIIFTKISIHRETVEVSL